MCAAPSLRSSRTNSWHSQGRDTHRPAALTTRTRPTPSQIWQTLIWLKPSAWDARRGRWRYGPQLWKSHSPTSNPIAYNRSRIRQDFLRALSFFSFKEFLYWKTENAL